MARKAKPKSYASLKRLLDARWSVFTRRRYADKDGNAWCVCCCLTAPWQRLQAGHYVSRVHLATRWLALNVWPCCYACNVLRRGNMAEFTRFLLDKYGNEAINTLIELKRQPVKLTRADLQARIDQTEAAIKALA